MPHSWPLVGRREELEFVDRATNRPGTAGVVVAGAPGVGKTRLAREALSRAEAEGRTTAWAQATRSGAGIPFGALAHLLPAGIAGAGRRNLLRIAADAISELSTTEPLVLGVDDTHLLDDHSASLVHLLAETKLCAIVATLRTGEPVPDPITVLWKDELAERLELQPLSQEETNELLEQALDPPVDAATRHRLWTATRGNVLFLREVVLGGLESGRLTRDRGVWRWRGAFADVPRLSDVLDERLRRLRAEERSLLEVVAAAEPVELEILESLDEARWLGSAENTGLLNISAGKPQTVAISHPLYAEALRSGTSPSRHRAIYRALADALGARTTPADPLRMATWRLEARDPADPELMLSAAKRASSLFDFDLSARLATTAIEVGGGWEANHVLAAARIGQGRPLEGDRVLAACQRDAESEDERVRAAISRAENLFWHMGRGDDADRILRELAETAMSIGHRDEVTVQQATFLLFAGHTEQAIEIARGLLARADVAPLTLVQAAMTTGWGLCLAGRGSDGKDGIARALPIAMEHVEEIPFGPDWVGYMTTVIDAISGRLAEAGPVLEVGHANAVDRGAWPTVSAHATFRGWFERLRGRPQTAKRLLVEAVGIQREVDLINQRSFTLGQLALCETLLGNLAGAEAALLEADAARVASFRMDDAPIGLAHAWVAELRGDRSRAIDIVRQTALTTGSMGQQIHEAAALHDLVRLGKPGAAAGRLEELARTVEGPLVPIYADHASALASRDAGALDKVALRFERIGTMLYAAEAAAEASRIYRREGRTGSALATAAKARAMADLCEGARTPALTHIDVDLHLTPREAEIATLAARGLSNREIAQRLVVSIRTVDNHLHSAYAKLGVGGRRELAPILLAGSE